MKNAVTLLVSLLVALVIVELGLRVVWNQGSAAVLMMSPPGMTMPAPGVVTYAADVPLRVTTVDEQGIIYDVKTHTNDAGMVDNVPYMTADNARRLAVVGDSYTAGYHGGAPWIPELRASMPGSWGLYGLGVSGTGIQHFDTLLQQVDPRADFDEVIVVAIGNDFYRDHWYLTAGDDGIWFCVPGVPPETCSAGRPPIIHYVPYDATTEEVLRLATPLLERNARAHSTWRLMDVYRRTVSLVTRESPTERLEDPKVVRNLAALTRIVQRYGSGGVTLLHVPTLPEVLEGEYDLALEDFARQNGIRYFPALFDCHFTPEMFHAREPHPNAAGYQALRTCIQGVVAPLVNDSPQGA